MLTFRQKTSAIVAVAALASLLFTATPAHADDATKSGGACWINADTDVTQCFDSAAKMADAVLAQTGGPLVRQGSAVARPAGVLVNYVIADLFTDLSYAGTITSITSTSSTICTTGSGKIGNLSGASNNTTSSYKSYLGCVTIIYDGAGQTGTSYGPAVNAPGVGGMNDRASSYNVN